MSMLCALPDAMEAASQILFEALLWKEMARLGSWSYQGAVTGMINDLCDNQKSI